MGHVAGGCRSALERLHGDAGIIAGAGDRDRFDQVIRRCTEIAHEFEKIGARR